MPGNVPYKWPAALTVNTLLDLSNSAVSMELILKIYGKKSLVTEVTLDCDILTWLCWEAMLIFKQELAPRSWEAQAAKEPDLYVVAM